MSTVTYSIGGAKFTRKTFASYPDQAIVVRLECDKPGQITFDLLMTSPHTSTTKSVGNDKLLITGELEPRERRGLIGPWKGDGLKFAAQTKIVADGGTVIKHNDKITVKDANAVTLIYVAATSFVNYQEVFLTLLD